MGRAHLGMLSLSDTGGKSGKLAAWDVAPAIASLLHVIRARRHFYFHNRNSSLPTYWAQLRLRSRSFCRSSFDRHKHENDDAGSTENLDAHRLLYLSIVVSKGHMATRKNIPKHAKNQKEREREMNLGILFFCIQLQPFYAGIAAVGNNMMRYQVLLQNVS